jgi:hypothetical protein
VGRGGRAGFVDAVDGVVVAERQQLDAGRGGRSDQIANGQLAIGVARVRLQVDALH